MAVVEKTIDILGDALFSAFIIERNFREGYPVDIYDEAVTALRNGALYGMKNVESVNFPNVITIGNNALYGCPQLKRVSFPAATVMYTGGIRECPSLEEVNAPLVTFLGDYVFANDTALVTINLPGVVSTST